MQYLYIIPCALIAIVLHELAHGLASHLLGDPTPKESGRLSLNPIRHLDPIGLVCLIVFRFGWAKPVMVNPTYYKKPKLGMGFVALAGPLMNFLIMILSFVFMWGTIKIFGLEVFNDNSIGYILFNFFMYLAIINLGLGLFNLIPIPPLDGSKIIGTILPDESYEEYMGYQRYGMFFMMGLLLVFNLLESYGIASPLDKLMDTIFYFFYDLMVSLL